MKNLLVAYVLVVVSLGIIAPQVLGAAPMLWLLAGFWIVVGYAWSSSRTAHAKERGL